MLHDASDPRELVLQSRPHTGPFRHPARGNCFRPVYNRPQAQTKLPHCTMSLAVPSSISPAKARVLAKDDDDVVIVSAVRTAMTKARKGGFKDTFPDLLLSHVLRAVYSKPGLEPSLIEDISVGNVLPDRGGASAARMASLHAGIPITTSVNSVNRQCSSGLTSVNHIASLIKIGQIDIGIGASDCHFHFLIKVDPNTQFRCRRGVYD